MIFRKLGADLPKRLSANEKTLSARRNSLGELAPPTVQESFDAGFIQAYKLIARGIDEISHPRRCTSRDQHGENRDTDFRKQNLRNGDTVRRKKSTTTNTASEAYYTFGRELKYLFNLRTTALRRIFNRHELIIGTVRIKNKNKIRIF